MNALRVDGCWQDRAALVCFQDGIDAAMKSVCVHGVQTCKYICTLELQD